MPFFDVTRTLKGGFAGYGVQDIAQTKTVESSVAPTPGANETVETNITATAQQDWSLNASKTTIPTTQVDRFGGFPNTG